MRCLQCAGSGKIMGSGMQIQDCSKCDGYGDLSCSNEAKKQIIDKRSKSYKEAIKDLQAIHPDYTRDEVCELFEEEFSKL